jgi:hypothetical protein
MRGRGDPGDQRMSSRWSSPQFQREFAGAEATPNAALVREQLRRLLAHPLFTNSKRYPVLLAYTVEQTLLGNASELKERTIGVEAFGREPSYDVNLDPVVRTTAAEVRKRLIQYYYSPHHAGELVIELPVGSYVPIFRDPGGVQPASASEPVLAQNKEASPQENVGSPAAHALPVEPARQRLKARHWMWTGLTLLIALLLGFAAGRFKPSTQSSSRQPSDMERFWNPITATSSRVTYCLAEPTEAVDLGIRETFGASEDASLNVYDVITLARSIVPLIPKNGAFRVLAASSTGFAQLREGPIVLVGAFDNPWTMRITQDLPFGFEVDNHVRNVVDRKSVPKRFWTLRWEVPNSKLAQDYAIVARIHDRVTGQPVIVLAGILGEGTEAASEVVSNPEYLRAVLQKAPKNWDQLNMEAIIETRVIEGHPGPPAVVAVDTW